MTERPTVEPKRVLAYERYDKVYPWGIKEDTDSGYHLGVFRERQIAHQMALAYNCHADLVAALEALADEQALFAAHLPPIYEQRLRDARAALAKAKE